MTGHEFLKHKRLEKGLSLRALGKQAGVSYVTIKQVEDGSNKPGLDTALKLLLALDIKVNDFLKVIGYDEHNAKKKVAVQGIEPRTLRI